jgi:hypothetical protein
VVVISNGPYATTTTTALTSKNDAPVVHKRGGPVSDYTLFQCVFQIVFGIVRSMHIYIYYPITQLLYRLHILGLLEALRLNRILVSSMISIHKTAPLCLNVLINIVSFGSFQSTQSTGWNFSAQLIVE